MEDDYIKCELFVEDLLGILNNFNLVLLLLTTTYINTICIDVIHDPTHVHRVVHYRIIRSC